MNAALSITLLRFVLAPLLVWALLQDHPVAALGIFLLGSLSDALDGYIARRFNQCTPLGALLDPLADKLLVACGMLTLLWQGHFPLWLAAAALLRDFIIMGGALAYHRVTGRLEMQPLALSKLNTTVQFTLVLVILATTAGYARVSFLQVPLTWLTLVTTLSSGVQYVVEWSRRAIKA
ncbi:CDP-diacylglycerol--glycerol-3-phosphate 3-phosphatidyltransferase [mine drainage metagenome]|uniref:CDP-diacylglycerol--glycerol-3-phosphate 3-phosphatidyltransferase n=1 Tax=mine drainage metagenome TaxID=410659 RepID=A0A1J5QCL2_9ZZZZ